MSAYSLEAAIEASLENIADGGGSILEHAALLRRDHGLTLEAAVERLEAAEEERYYGRYGRYGEPSGIQ